VVTAGKKNSFDAKNAKLITLKSAVYNSTNNTVTLTPKKRFALTKLVQLRVSGQPPSGLQDSLGRLIDTGTIADKREAMLSRFCGATICAIASQRLCHRAKQVPSSWKMC
jgi:hypothetical protein